jgi:hypothetical protein
MAAATAAAVAAAAAAAEPAAARAADVAAAVSHWVECRGADGSVWFVSKDDATVAQWTLPAGGVVVDSIQDF